MRVRTPNGDVPWTQSPLSIAAALIAAMHFAASIAFLGFLLTIPTADRLETFAIYAIGSFAVFLAGFGVSLFAPGWRRKALLVGLNVLAIAWWLLL